MGGHRLLRIFFRFDPLRTLWPENENTGDIQRKPIYCGSITTAPNASCYPKKYKQKDLEELVLVMIKQQVAFAEDTIKQLKRANQTLNIPKLRYRKKQYEKKLALSRQEKWYCMNSMQKKRFP